jgi:hypothetical protein
LERLAPRSPGAIEPQGFLRIQRDQGLLGRGKACRVEGPRVDIPHVARLPIIPTVLFGEDHIIQDSAELLPVDPEPALALGDASLSIKVVTMPGDTTVAVGWPRKKRVGEFLREHFRRIAPALRQPQNLDRDGWEALIRKQALMRRRIIGVEKGLMALFPVPGSAGERTLIILEAPLDITMRLDPVQRAFPLRTHDRLMVDLKPPTDRFKRVRCIGPATVRHEGHRGAIPQTGRVQDHQRGPRRFCRRQCPGEDGPGIALQEQDAPPLDAVEGKSHLAAINAPILMTVLGFVGMGLWGWLASALRHMGDVIVHQFVERPKAAHGPDREVRLGEQAPAPKRPRIRMGLREQTWPTPPLHQCGNKVTVCRTGGLP